MSKQKRYKLRDSDRSGFTFREVELVKDNGSLVGPGEFDAPPPSRQSTGGEGEFDRSGIRANWDSYDSLNDRETQSITASGGITFPIIPDSQGKSDLNNAWVYVTAGELSFDPAITSILHLDGTDGSTTFTDSSIYNRAFTGTGNAQIDTAQFKFGSASLLLAGSGDYILTPTSDDFNVGAGDWTVDGWVRFNTTGGTRIFGGQWETTGVVSNARNFAIDFNGSTQIRLVYSTNGINVSIVAVTWNHSTNTWYHVAVTRKDGIVRFFIDGTQVGADQSVPATFHGNPSTAFAIGAAAGSNNNHLDGWVDEFRFIKGVAVWTSNFTPPTSAYSPNYALVVSKNPQVSRGYNGSQITIQSVGSSFILSSGSGLSLKQNFFMDSGAVLNLIYNATDNLWHETSRSHETRFLGV